MQVLFAVVFFLTLDAGNRTVLPQLAKPNSTPQFKPRILSAGKADCGKRNGDEAHNSWTRETDVSWELIGTLAEVIPGGAVQTLIQCSDSVYSQEVSLIREETLKQLNQDECLVVVLLKARTVHCTDELLFTFQAHRYVFSQAILIKERNIYQCSLFSALLALVPPLQHTPRDPSTRVVQEPAKIIETIISCEIAGTVPSATNSIEVIVGQKYGWMLTQDVDLCALAWPLYASSKSIAIHRRVRRKLYANVNWTEPQYYNTTRAIAVGTTLYYFTRGVDSIFLSGYDTLTNAWTDLSTYPWLTDVDGWSSPAHYSTIRLAAIGSKLYIYGRGATSAYLASYNTLNAKWTQLPGFAFLTDDDGFTLEMYYLTIRMAVVGTCLYITARGNSQINIAKFDTETLIWRALPALQQFTSDATWGRYQYYKTFSLVSWESILYLYVRGPNGVNLVGFDTTTSSWWSTVFTNSYYSDASGWGVQSYFETMQVLTVDNRIYIVARGASNLYLAYYDIAAETIAIGTYIGQYTDAGDWNLPQYYQTIQLTYTSTNIYAIGRGFDGLDAVGYSTSENSWTSLAYTPAFTDAIGWNEKPLYNTITQLCIGLNIYVIGRNSAALDVAIYNIPANSWSAGATCFYPCYNTCMDCLGSLHDSCTSCYPLALLSGPAPATCVCGSGYFPSPDSSKCSSCDSSCQDCIGTGSSMCTQCYPNAVLQSSPISACICTQGYYPNPSVNACDQCDSSCAACIGPSAIECTLCRLNSILLGTSPNACGCPAGFYLTSLSTGLCNTCDASCVECNGAGPNLCRSCHPNATLETNNSCKCADLFYMDMTTGLCTNCNLNCLDCTNPSITGCTSCFSNASLQGSAPSSCECNIGSFPNSDASNCSACDRSCKGCGGAASNMCTQCYPNAALQTPPISACICTQGYYPNPSANACDQCDSSCTACAGPSAIECTLCRLNSILLGTSPNACGCPAGFYLTSLSTGLCNTCDASCVECNGAGPNQCRSCPPNALLQIDNSCECSDFFYMDTDSKSCVNCNSNCYLCMNSSNTGCTMCFSGAVLQGVAPSSCACNEGSFPSSDVRTLYIVKQIRKDT